MADAWLVWDPGFLPRFGATLAALAAVALGLLRSPEAQLAAWEAYQEALFPLLSGAHRLGWWSVVGLLSSSCCALQLLLNLVNFGCAGFNTYLGPLRPSLCAVTLCLQGCVWATVAAAAKQGQDQAMYVLPFSLLSVVLTLLPELTDLANRARAGPKKQHKAAAVLAVENMGCVACVKKVCAAAAELDAWAEVDLKRAQVEVRYDEPAQLDGVIGKLKAAGFPAKVSDGAPAPSAKGGFGGGVLAVVFGLLGSSCCLLQLLVNLLATLQVANVGCAGFNKVLGPYRTPLRCLAAAWLALSWLSACYRKQPKMPLVFRTLVCVVLTFLPEVLLSSPDLAAVQGQRVALNVTGMGCEACQRHVQGILTDSGALAAQVDWKTGVAYAVVGPEWALENVADKLALDGYEAETMP